MGEPGTFGAPLVAGPGSGAPAAAFGPHAIAAAPRATVPHEFRQPGGPDVQGYETDDLNAIRLYSRVWFNWTVRKPTLFVPIVSRVNVTGNAALAGAQFEIYYAPNRTPGTLALLPETCLQFSQVSRGCGVVFLPHAGKWSLFWNAPNSLSQGVDMSIVDASDPGVAARYLFDSGIHQVSHNDSIVTTVADQIVLASNRNRKGFYIAMDTTTPGAATRLGFNTAALNNAGVKVGGASPLPSSYSMAGEHCFLGDIHAIRDASAGADVTIIVVEWF